MINVREAKQFQLNIIQDVLMLIGLWSIEAEHLMLGTALKETNLDYVRQFGGGPGRGYYQIEPNTFADIWSRYLPSRQPKLKRRIDKLLAQSPDPVKQLETNLAFSTAIARVRFYMVPEPLPRMTGRQDDRRAYCLALGRYWDKYYNCNPDHGFPEEFAALLFEAIY